MVLFPLSPTKGTQHMLFELNFGLKSCTVQVIFYSEKIQISYCNVGEQTNPTKPPNITENLAPLVFQSGISDQMVSASSDLEIEVKSLVSALKKKLNPSHKVECT